MTKDEFQHYYNLYSTRDAEAAKAEAARVNAIGIDGNSAVAVNLGGEWCLMLKSARDFAIEHGILTEQVLMHREPDDASVGIRGYWTECDCIHAEDSSWEHATFQRVYPKEDPKC